MRKYKDRYELAREIRSIFRIACQRGSTHEAIMSVMENLRGSKDYARLTLRDKEWLEGVSWACFEHIMENETEYVYFWNGRVVDRSERYRPDFDWAKFTAEAYGYRRWIYSHKPFNENAIETLTTLRKPNEL